MTLRPAVALFALLMVACGPKTGTVTPPAVPNAKLILSLETIRTSCIIAQPFIESAAVGQWVGVGCPAAANASIAAIQAAGPVGKIQGVLAAVQAFLNAKPAGISPQDAAYVNAAVVLVNQFVLDFKALHPDAT